MATSRSAAPTHYWDSCLFLDLLMADKPERVKLVASAFQEAEEGRAMILISSLVLAEVRPKEGYAGADWVRPIEQLLEADRPCVRHTAVTNEIAKISRRIGVKHEKLSGPDALHIAVALHLGANALFTFDGEKRDKTNNRSNKMLPYDGKLVWNDFVQDGADLPRRAPLRICMPECKQMSMVGLIPGR